MQSGMEEFSSKSPGGCFVEQLCGEELEAPAVFHGETFEFAGKHHKRIKLRTQALVSMPWFRSSPFRYQHPYIGLQRFCLQS
jgi:hypothetical protein